MKKHQHTEFSIDENQRKNLFDLCVGIVVLIIVVLTLVFNRNTPQHPPQNNGLHRIE